MDKNETVLALSALAHSTRLDVFRLLVKHEPKGLPAGEIAETLGVIQNTMSAHLSILMRAGLISSKRNGRSMIYRADLTALRSVTLFLLKDCCGGHEEICAPLIADLTNCCSEERIDA